MRKLFFIFLIATNTVFSQNCVPPNISTWGESCNNSVAFMLSAVSYLNNIGAGLTQIAYYDEFEIQYREVNAPNWNNLTVNKAFGEFRIFGLEPCTKYELKAKTICNGTSSQISNSLFFQTSCTRPVDLKIEQITTTEAKVNYKRYTTGLCSANGHLNAEIQYRETNGSWQSVYCNTGQACNLFLLTPNTKYSVRVRFKYDVNKFSDFTNEVSFTTKPGSGSQSGGNNNGGNNNGGNNNGGNNNGGSNNGNGFSSIGIPNLNVTSGANFVIGISHTISVNFDLNYDRIEYEIANNPSFNQPMIASYFYTTQASFQATFPSVGTYYMRVRGRLPNGTYSNWSSFTKVFGIQNQGGGSSNVSSSCPVTNFKIETNKGFDCLEVNWFDAVYASNVQKVKIEYREQGNYTWNSIEVANGLHVSVKLQNLIPCTNYEVRSQSQCANNTTSAISNMAFSSTTCPKPINVKSVNVTASGSKITFSQQVGYSCSAITHFPFEIQYKTSSGNWITQNFSGGTSGLLNSLAANTSYRVRVRYVFANNHYSDYSNEIQFTTLNSSGGGNNNSGQTIIISAPLKGSTLSGLSTTIKWNNVSAQSYEVQIALSATFNLATISTSTVNSLFVNSLQANKTYYCRVRSVDNNGIKGSWSATSYFKTN